MEYTLTESPLTPELIHEVIPVHRASFRHAHPELHGASSDPHTYQQYWNNISAAPYHLCCVRQSSHLLGFALLTASRVDRTPNASELRAMYVHPNHLRNGIGTALMQWAVGFLRATDVATLHIQVIKGNPAEQFYVRQGASPLREVQKEIDGQILTVVVLTRTI
ncbi:MAG: GNAT family N-acetyltransferase [Ignavibacteria bacterium]|nr:GNAT family N-acetyltransferase [Ignavibacteria bacterium]